MKLWLLRPINERSWPDYDATYGLVVRAETEDQAREIVRYKDPKSWMNNFGTEGRNAWLQDRSTCTELTADGDPGVVIKDEHWG